MTNHEHAQSVLPPQMLTVKEVAEILALSENGVYKFVADGVLPAVKLGRVYRFRRADIKTFTGGAL